MKLLAHPATHRVLGLVIGAVFLYASLDKIAHPPEFARIVYHYQVIGPSQSIPPLVPNTFAVVLPWIEAVAGLLLMAGVWRREAALLTAAMLVTFVLAVGSALYRGIDVQNCGCFTVGAEGRRAGWGLLLGDTLLLAGALALVAVPVRTSESGATAEALPAR
ncbi:MAG: DoxX family membrane protein [Acidobacteria bacterium]|nr:DoxX family membrane protein [Acidobacteriota bacterium]